MIEFCILYTKFFIKFWLREMPLKFLPRNHFYNLIIQQKGHLRQHPFPNFFVLFLKQEKRL